jgi:hypothetical protein
MPIKSYYSFALFWVLTVQVIVDLQLITKGHRRFLAIMVDIIGDFKDRFSGIAAKNLPDCPTTGFSRLDPAMVLPGKAAPLLPVVTDQQGFQVVRRVAEN